MTKRERLFLLASAVLVFILYSANLALLPPHLAQHDALPMPTVMALPASSAPAAVANAEQSGLKMVSILSEPHPLPAVAHRVRGSQTVRLARQSSDISRPALNVVEIKPLEIVAIPDNAAPNIVVIPIRPNDSDGYTIVVSTSTGDGAVGTPNTDPKTPASSGLMESVMVGSSPTVVLNGSPVLPVEVFSVFTDPGATATDPEDGVLPVTVSGSVNTNAVGSYVLSYSATDSDSNTTTVTRTVNVVDTTPPVITLLGANPLTMEVLTPLSEPGFTASDNYDGDLTSQVIINDDAMSTAVLGPCGILYTVTDSSGNSTTVFRAVNVVDTGVPLVALKGANPLTLMVGDPYIEPGSTAHDIFDGDLTPLVSVDSTSVNTAAPGSYPVHYSVMDSNGNTGSAMRTVIVEGVPTGTGVLIVTKTVSWSGADPLPGESFQVCVTGVTVVYGPNCQTAPADGTPVPPWTNLAPGTYQVEEQFAPGDVRWGIPSMNGQIVSQLVVTVAADTTTTVAIDNLYCVPNWTQDLKVHGQSRLLPPYDHGVVVNISDRCSYPVGLAAYRKVDEHIPNQQLHDYELGVVPPNAQLPLSVELPGCAAQVDLFYGMLVTNFVTQGLYGTRLFQAVHLGGAVYCDTDINMQVIGFELVDTEHDAVIGPLTDGTLNLADLPSQHLAIVAKTAPQTVGSVVFKLDGELVQVENFALYALHGGNTYSDLPGWTPEVGKTYIVQATPYLYGGGAGSVGMSLTVMFTVMDGTPVVGALPVPDTPDPSDDPPPPDAGDPGDDNPPPDNGGNPDGTTPPDNSGDPAPQPEDDRIIPEPEPVIIGLPGNFLGVNTVLSYGLMQPTFVWTQPDGAALSEWYRIVVTDSADLVILDTWVDAQALCGDDGCYFTPGIDLLPYGLRNGQYRWWLQGWANGVLGEWNEGEPFTITAALPLLPVLSVNANQGRPTILWNDDVNAAVFHLVMVDSANSIIYDQLHDKRDGFCYGATCSLTPDLDLTPGTYQVYMQAWGAGGFSTGGIDGWAGPAGFAVADAPPSDVTGLQVVSVENARPTLRWNAAAGATKYELWIGTTGPNYVTHHDQTYLASEIGCENGGICQVSMNGVLPIDNYLWFVRAWGPGGYNTGGTEGWIEGPIFSSQ